MKNIITYDELKRQFSYNKETGLFTRLVSTSSRVKVGEANGWLSKGYVNFQINGLRFKAHRLAWLYEYGYLPENEIDHIDRVRHHNWISNLREVSRQCNMRNTGNLKSNKSGVKGVYFEKQTKKWRANLKVNGIKYHFGRHFNFKDAVMARWLAEKKYNFPNCCTTSSAYEYLIDNNLI